jgi:hypothetical protein
MPPRADKAGGSRRGGMSPRRAEPIEPGNASRPPETRAPEAPDLEAPESTDGPGRSDRSPGHLKKAAGARSAREFAPGRQGRGGSGGPPGR